MEAQLKEVAAHELFHHLIVAILDPDYPDHVPLVGLPQYIQKFYPVVFTFDAVTFHWCPPLLISEKIRRGFKQFLSPL
jgi:hypothetical protein